MSSLFVSSSDDIKGLVARSDMILIVPTSTVRTDYISGIEFVSIQRIHLQNFEEVGSPPSIYASSS